MPMNLDNWPKKCPLGGPEIPKGSPNWGRKRYVGFYWTYANPTRRLEASKTILAQAIKINEEVDRQNGVMIHEELFQEAGDRPTETIGTQLRRAIKICQKYNATLIYMGFGIEYKWREHRYLRNIIDSEKIDDIAIREIESLIEYFRKNRSVEAKLYGIVELYLSKQEIETKKRRLIDKFQRRKRFSARMKVSVVKHQNAGLLTIEKSKIQQLGVEANKNRALAFQKRLFEKICEAPHSHRGTDAIVKFLNSQNFYTSHGKQWNSENLRKAISRLNRIKVEFGRIVIY